MPNITTPNLIFTRPTGTAMEAGGLPMGDKASNDIYYVKLLPNTSVMPAVVLDFVMGKEGSPPTTVDAIGVANRVVQAAQANVENPDIVVTSDGELAFYFRLPDGRLLMAELDVEGMLWAGVHDDNGGTGDSKSELMMPAEEERLIRLFQQVP